jgi:aspartate/methionine/tyrosine aminotransferase
LARFDHKEVRIDILRRRAFNYRWAEVPEDVIPLTAADPDFPVAKEIVEALTDYIKDGYLSYTPKLGLPEFRVAISRALAARKQEHIAADLILPIDSAARGMHVIAQTVLARGDEAIIFDPMDYLFKQAILSAGATPVLFPGRSRDGRIDVSQLERFVTPRTRLIGLCNPHNPLGMLYPEEDLRLILDVAGRHGLYILNDEIWSDIVFPGEKFLSILSIEHAANARTLSVYGFSKAFGVAGLRIGCVYCQDKELFDKVVDKSGVITTAGGITSLSQVAGIACVEKCYYWVDEFVQHLARNRDYALSRLSTMPGITCHSPQATYLLFPDITGTGMGSEALCDFLVEKHKLALVPGAERFFGPGAEGHVRICFATSREILKEGFDRLEEGLRELASGSSR